MGNLVKGTSYCINNKWFEILWSGEKYSYCRSYNEKKKSWEKELLKNSKLEQGEYCPF